MKHFKNLTVLLSFVSLSISACATSSTQESNPTGTIIEYKSGPEGFDTRTFFYVGKNEVVAIDSQFTPELAKKSIAHLRQFTDKPIKALIITHPNPDKFNGASVFKKEGAQIIGSKATADAMAGVNAYKKYYFVHMAKMFSEESYPSLTPIDETFEDSLTLNLKGDQVIRLVETNQPAISSNQTVVYIEGAGGLFVGDMIHHKAH
ncbi:MAG: MBL fold metallo-hydrolase, partial [Bdellovibrionales bacterium]|nr:MBL fold metallo-hydrolase [Bdellovibrionales bacterium]